MKKALLITTVSGFIPQFESSNVKILKQLGYEIHYASNYYNPFYGTVDQKISEMGMISHQIDFVRSPYKILKNVKAFRQLRKLEKIEHFDLVHCHTPMGGILGRLVFGRQKKANTIYTAHGFHFYKGAPLRNWFLYFPVEWFCSWITDILITINREDYHFAKKYLYAKRVEYIPGIGIDLTQFEDIKDDTIRGKMRSSLGIQNEKTKILLSVGELNKNKNHEVVIKALLNIKNVDYMYFICGVGSIKNNLQQLIKKYSLQDRIKLLGYREDMKELYRAADLFVFPSKREGLPVALMEAMASGLPVVCGRIRGNVDLIKDKEGGILVDDVTKPVKFLWAIETMMENSELCEMAGQTNRKVIRKFSAEKVNEKMKEIYLSFGKRER